MKCPGQDTKYWKPGAIFEVECPRCKFPVEFFKDDTSRKCNGCGFRFVNPRMDFGCAAYCQFAEQCMGTLPGEIRLKRDTALKEVVALEMKRFFKSDFQRIGHTMRVAEHAENIGKEMKGNLAIIIVAAYLLHTGKDKAAQTHDRGSDRHHEEESTVIAREILSKIGADRELIEKVLEVIFRHHHPDGHLNLESMVVHDADTIALLEKNPELLSIPPCEMEAGFASILLTSSGRRIARTVLSGNKSEMKENA